MKRNLFLLIFIFWNFSGYAEEPDALFAQAESAYAEGNYAQSIVLYDSILSLGYESLEVYYNLGNAHYKLNHIAPAILNFERALQFSPSNEDVNYNLRLANLRVIDNLKSVPDLFITAWIKNLFWGNSARSWAIFSIVLLWLAVSGGALFLLVKSPFIKRIGFFGGIALLVLSLTAFGLSIHRKNLDQNSLQGIIFTPNAYVKDAPGGKTDLLVLHEGVKVKVLDEVQGWTKIRIEDANIGKIEGFVQKSSIVTI